MISNLVNCKDENLKFTITLHYFFSTMQQTQRHFPDWGRLLGGDKNPGRQREPSYGHWATAGPYHRSDFYALGKPYPRFPFL